MPGGNVLFFVGLGTAVLVLGLAGLAKLLLQAQKNSASTMGAARRDRGRSSAVLPSSKGKGRSKGVNSTHAFSINNPLRTRKKKNVV